MRGMREFAEGTLRHAQVVGALSWGLGVPRVLWKFNGQSTEGGRMTKSVKARNLSCLRRISAIGNTLASGWQPICENGGCMARAVYIRRVDVDDTDPWSAWSVWLCAGCFKKAQQETGT